jgi:hypothetical protein
MPFKKYLIFVDEMVQCRISAASDVQRGGLLAKLMPTVNSEFYIIEFGKIKNWVSFEADVANIVYRWCAL